MYPKCNLSFYICLFAPVSGPLLLSVDIPKSRNKYTWLQWEYRISGRSKVCVSARETNYLVHHPGRHLISCIICTKRPYSQRLRRNDPFVVIKSVIDVDHRIIKHRLVSRFSLVCRVIFFFSREWIWTKTTKGYVKFQYNKQQQQHQIFSCCRKFSSSRWNVLSSVVMHKAICAYFLNSQWSGNILLFRWDSWGIPQYRHTNRTVKERWEASAKLLFCLLWNLKQPEFMVVANNKILKY